MIYLRAWLQQFVRLKPLVVFFAAFSIVFFLFVVTLKYTFPFLMGFLLALLAQPVIRWLKKALHMPPSPAALIATLAVYAVLFGLMFLLGYWLVKEMSSLFVYLSNLSENDISAITGPINSIIAQLGAALQNIDANFIKDNQEKIIGIAQSSVGVLSKVLGTILRLLTSLPVIVTMLIVMIFSTYFFSKDMWSIKRRLLLLLPFGAAGHLRRFSRSGVSMGGRYIGSYLLIYFITFLETLLVFFVLGVPYPLVLSIITGIADILPVLGPGTIYLPLSLIYLVQGDYFRAGALLVCWLLISAIRQIIEPKIVSSSINIHPLTVLAGLYFSLVAGNLWILIYVSLLAVSYHLLVQAGILPTFFENEDSGASGNKNTGGESG